MRAAALVLGTLVLVGSTSAAQVQSDRPGVPPESAWECPLTHPIKGNFTTYSGERCIYHVPGGYFYGKTKYVKTKPEQCYVTEPDAVKDGCRPSKRSTESRPASLRSSRQVNSGVNCLY